MKTIRVGSRDSALAVTQARCVMAAAAARHPELRFSLITMKTSGDRALDRPLADIGGKGLFVKELDEALHSGRVDVCVHSYKDLPVPDNPALPVLAAFAREDARDVLVLPPGGRENRAAPLGTSSPRRAAQLAALYPGWRVQPVRGNIQTRLAKLDAGEFGGLVLAAAGLKRLGLFDRATRVFSVTEMIPAAGQGILAVQARRDDDRDGEYDWLADLNDPDAAAAVAAERAFVLGMAGGCSAPIAAHATLGGERLCLRAMYVNGTGQILRGELSGGRAAAREIGRALAAKLAAEGDGCSEGSACSEGDSRD